MSVDRETKSSKSKDPIECLFLGHEQLYTKLKEQAKLNFRTPDQQLVYYTWKCIEFED